MNQDLPPPIALFRLATGYYVSCAIHAVARLGIADRLKDGPQSHEALAIATGTHAAALRRVLRLLASAGVLDRGGRRQVFPHRDRRLPARRRARLDACRGAAFRRTRSPQLARPALQP